jgi:hypothetical protein
MMIGVVNHFSALRVQLVDFSVAHHNALPAG